MFPALARLCLLHQMINTYKYQVVKVSLGGSLGIREISRLHKGNLNKFFIPHCLSVRKVQTTVHYDI